MGIQRHWLAVRRANGKRQVEVFTDAAAPSIMGGWTLSGPYVLEAEQPRGAVSDHWPKLGSPEDADATHHAHLTEAEWERDRYRAALTRAHEQLGKFDGKGPKQVGRAMLTIESALAPRETLPKEETDG